jgi:hypothetical protein
MPGDHESPPDVVVVAVEAKNTVGS